MSEQALIDQLQEEADEYVAKLAEVWAERDRMRRLFNRLEGAVTHHKAAHESRELFVDEPDTALWKARDKILKDYSEGTG